MLIEIFRLAQNDVYAFFARGFKGTKVANHN